MSYQIAFIGYGLRSETMMTAFRSIDADISVAAVCDPREAELLTQEDYQERMAEAICGGILEYLEQKGASADSPAEELP